MPPRPRPRALVLAPLLVAATLVAGCAPSPGGAPDQSSSPPADAATPVDDGGATPPLGFFITSRRGGANLGGLAGADTICANLAAAVGVTTRRWAAYLSADADGATPAVDARDRIGRGPWYNARGVEIADDVATLHDPGMMGLVKATGLDETGAAVPGRGDSPNEHDILTGSTSEGRLNRASTCANWTSEGDAAGDIATVGHFDRQGGGQAPTSWNSAHASRGCSAAALVSTGGAGRFYCFAID